MCRVLSYLGKPIVIEELLYKSDNSFIKQSYHPQYMSHMLNLAGFGMAAWDHHSHNKDSPYLYKTAQLPFYDENLRNLAGKIASYCLLAHLRGVTYSEKQTISVQNVHPFFFHHSGIALAHNGALQYFESMKYDLLPYITEDYQHAIRGTTDSEWIYAIFLSRLPKEKEKLTIANITEAVMQTLEILKKVRKKHHIQMNSPVNLFISNGKFIAATRFTIDYGWQPMDVEFSSQFIYHSLWYTYGERYGLFDNEYKMQSGKTKSSIIIASEPLTQDTTTWVEVPEYTLLIAHLDKNEIKIVSHDLAL